MGFVVMSFDPIAQPSGSFNNALPKGCGIMRIKNDSIVDLKFSINNFASMATEIAPGATVDIPGQSPYTIVYWTTNYKLSTNVKTIASKVTVTIYNPSETPPDISSDLPRHFNPTNVGFIFNVAITPGSTVNWAEVLVFNPLTSPTNATFISASIAWPNSGVFFNLQSLTSDPGRSFVGTGANLVIGGPASNAIVEFNANLVSPDGGGLRQVTSIANTPFEFIPFPLQILCAPGTGLVLASPPGATTSNLLFTFIWTETTI